jgi:hypothetical protein
LQVENPITGASYVWESPTGALLEGAIISAQAQLSDNGLWRVSAISAEGCSSTLNSFPVFVNPRPARPRIFNSGPACVGVPIFVSTEAEPGQSYVWELPGGGVSSGSRIEAAGEGVYTVYAVAEGCSSERASTVVSRLPAPLVPVIFGGGGVCAGSSVSLAVETPQSGAVYEWRGPGGFSQTGSSVTLNGVQSAQSGVYSVRAVRDGCGSDWASANVEVLSGAVNAALEVSSQRLCEGESLSLQTNAVPAGALFRWFTPGRGTVESDAGRISLPGLKPEDSGEYSVAVVTGACTSVSARVRVEVAARPSLISSSATQEICGGARLQMGVSASPGASVHWQGPLGFRFEGAQVQILNAQPLQAGVYSAVAVSQGCSSAVLEIEVRVKPAPVLQRVTSNSPVCSGSQLAVTAQGVGISEVVWETPSGVITGNAILSYPSASGAQSGWYSAVAVLEGCSSAKQSVYAEVFAAPSGVSVTSNSPVCGGGSLILSGVGESISGYQWSGPGGFSSTLSSPVISGVSAAQSGVYSLIVWNGICTSGVSTLEVTV